MLPTSYPILTPRLQIRPFARADRQALLALRAVPEISRFLYTEPMTVETVDAALDQRLAMPAFDGDEQVLALLAELRDTQEMVGDLTLFYRRHEQRQAEIGFILHPDHHGKGLGREAAVELLRLGFEGLGLHRIYGRCDGRNTASATLMLRLGMRQEGHLVQNDIVKGEWTDELIFAMLAEEWFSAARS